MARPRAALEAVPEQLHHATSQPPKTSTSWPSNDPALFQSPKPPSEEQERREWREQQLIRENWESKPNRQFHAQAFEEYARLKEGSETQIRHVPASSVRFTVAYQNVKERWLEQGIWNEDWQNDDQFKGVYPWGKWKHEELDESESMPNLEASVHIPRFLMPPPEEVPTPRQWKNGKDLRQFVKRRLLRERKREASRPIHQFLFQVSKEREWIQDVMNAPQDCVIHPSNIFAQTAVQALTKSGWPYDKSRTSTSIPNPAAINTIAYELVKDTWIKRKIWDRKWGILPGMSWKHEQPLEEILSEEICNSAGPIQADVLNDSSCGTREAPPRSTSELPPPTKPIYNTSDRLTTAQQEPRAAIVSDKPISSSLNASAREPLSVIDPSSLTSDDNNYASSASHTWSHHFEIREDSRLPSPHTPRQGDGELPVEDGQISHTERSASAPIPQSMISKAYKKDGPGTRQRPKAGRLAPDLNDPMASPGSSHVQPRRSKRLKEIERNRATGPTGIDTNRPDGSSEARSNQIRAVSNSTGSVNTQGISKRIRSRPRPRKKLYRLE